VRKSAGILVITVLALGIGMISAATKASAAWPGQNGYIIFSGDTNSVRAEDEIWAVRADGSDLHMILPGSATQDAVPYEVSPDGSSLLLMRPASTPSLAVETLNIATGAITLIDDPDLFSGDADPAYSPDGSQISFQRDSDHQYYVRNANGTGTPTAVGPSQPFAETGEGAISPDGAQQLSIAPAADVPGGGNQLYITDLATGTTTRLTAFQPDPKQPHWQFQPVYKAMWQTVPAASSTPPVVSHQTSPAAPDGTNGWYVSAPTVTFTCAGASPIVSCLVDGGTSASKTLGQSSSPQTITATGIDSLGGAGHDSATGFLVDLSPPALTCNQSNPAFTVGDVATLSATVSDAISGPSSSTVSAAASTSSAGNFSVSLTGQDKAGNHAAISCPYTVKAAQPANRFLVGDQALETHVDSNAAGVAEAFHFTASASGVLDHFSVYLDKTSKASRVVVGIYSGTATHPTALLTQAAVTAPATTVWNIASTTPVGLVSGQDYWITILAPAGTGTVAFRDRCCGGGGTGSTETSKSSSLTSLPATWLTGTRYSDGPFSAYGYASS
jgi:hypothetical protein